MAEESEEAPAPEFNEAGVDSSLIRWLLALTPAERLDTPENQANGIRRIREWHGITWSA